MISLQSTCFLDIALKIFSSLLVGNMPFLEARYSLLDLMGNINWVWKRANSSSPRFSLLRFSLQLGLF